MTCDLMIKSFLSNDDFAFYFVLSVLFLVLCHSEMLQNVFHKENYITLYYVMLNYHTDV